VDDSEISPDPYRAYRFRLEIRGVAESHFTECDGLEVYAGPNPELEPLPGRVEYRAVTLRFGVGSRALWEWIMTTSTGSPERRDVSIVSLGNDAGEVTRWDLFATWPTEWRGAPLDSTAEEVAIESVTLAAETIHRT